jgi:hypothetical protein
MASKRRAKPARRPPAKSGPSRPAPKAKPRPKTSGAPAKKAAVRPAAKPTKPVAAPRPSAPAKPAPRSPPAPKEPVPELQVPLPGGRRHVLSLSFVRDGDEFLARLETDGGHITELKNRSLDQLLTLVAGELEDLLD